MGKEHTSARTSCRGSKHPMYIGIRKRKWGVWVSEIRVPRKKKRIWPGSFHTPEMVARAHDAAALALRGDSGRFNFPESIHSLPRSQTFSVTDIQAVAAGAACSSSHHREEQEPQPCSTNNYDDNNNDCGDSELLLNKPYNEVQCTHTAKICRSEMAEWLDLQNLLMIIADSLPTESSVFHHRELFAEEEQHEDFSPLWNFN